MKLININLIFLILISFCNCIIIIPFKEYLKKEPDNFTEDDVINYWEQIIIYSNSSIGTPPQKIIMILNSENYGVNLFQNMCDFPDSSYIKEQSSSFNIERSINGYSKNNVSLINETLYFYDDLKLKKQKFVLNMKFLYSDFVGETQKELYHKNTCINFGLDLGWMYYQEYRVNLINQLINKKNIIETYDFSFKYNSENEGQIVIGAEPHIYEPENYYFQQYRIVGAVDKNGKNSRNWFLNFNKLYYSYKIKSNGRIINETIGLIKSLRIKFDMGLINGPNEYKEMIKRHFFNELISEGKCFEKIVVEKKTIFFCDKSAKNIIKDDFPTLYFEMNDFNKIFELTYKDLFREKNGKIYFLVYFKEYSDGEYFTVGKIFLKKYFFIFNQEIKKIGFYNENLPGGKKKAVKNYSFFNNIYIIVAIIVLIIIFSILGFFLGKLVYNSVRKKRMNELEDNFEYNTQEKLKNNDNDDNNRLYKNDNDDNN